MFVPRVTCQCEANRLLPFGLGGALQVDVAHQQQEQATLCSLHEEM